MRDPCIARGPDGTFHMVWTVSWEAPAIGYASSTDLIHWSEQQEIKPFEHEANARNCWAPELTYDPYNEQFMIYWSTTIPGKFPETDSSNIKGRNHRFYYTLTKDFESFSPTKMLYNPGFNCIDASIYAHGGRWLMFLKDETRYPEVAKNLKIAWADQLTGPYSPASEPISQHWVEGPTALRLGSLWYLYYDEYPNDEHPDFKIGLKLSRDLQHWEDVSPLLQVPEGMRHGTALKVPTEVVEELKRLEAEF
jgi:beta-xylosidase